ncbi:MAG TPA: ABC transporter permease [Tepidisphaeraceae bacterium]|nr:ABC transporter permease [Tepidisphaeraceae bacterium]
MWAYIVRRILLTIPIVLGVVLITIVLFSYVAADPARAWAGRIASEAQLDAIRAQMGLDKPRWFKWSVPIREIEATGRTLAVSTPWAHGLEEGDRFVISGVGNGHDGTFAVAEVKGPKGFTYRSTAGDPAATQPIALASDEDASLHHAELTQRLASGFDSQLLDIITFRIFELKSMRYQQPIWKIIKEKAPASMAIQVPAFLIALGLQLSLALYAANKRGRVQDLIVTLLSVLILAVPALSVYLFAQWAFGMQLGWFPVAGWESSGLQWMKYAALPIFISVLLGIGSGIRLYRTVMIDEIYSDYVRTARAKGLNNRQVLFTHVLKNGLIPVITNTVTALPSLILGALLLERIFQIPGLGNFTVEALNNYDRTVVMGMTFILSIVYCLLILVSDILYTLVNPQVSLK